MLKSLGITPNGMVGHSTGEIVCAYVDGGLTLEQTMLTAYNRGYCVMKSAKSAGSMAAVGKLQKTLGHCVTTRKQTNNCSGK